MTRDTARVARINLTVRNGLVGEWRRGQGTVQPLATARLVHLHPPAAASSRGGPHALPPQAPGLPTVMALLAALLRLRMPMKV